MIYRGALLLALALSGPVEAKKPPAPNWDCSFTQEAGADTWEADWFSARWHRFTETRAYLAASVHQFRIEDKALLAQASPYDPALDGILSVGPHIARSTKPLWAHIAAGPRQLPASAVSDSNGFYGTAIFVLADVANMLGDADVLTITFYHDDGAILNRTTLTAQDFRKAITRLVPLAAQYQEREAHPEDVCVDENDAIIV